MIVTILGWLLVRTRTTNMAVAKIVGQVGIGVAVPVLPLVAYHVLNGSLVALVQDTVLAAAGETQMAFFGSGWYGLLPLAGLYQAVTSFDAVKIANGLYWLVLPLLSAVNGWYALSAVRRGDRNGDLVVPMARTYPLDAAVEALEYVRTGHPGGKVALIP